MWLKTTGIAITLAIVGFGAIPGLAIADPSTPYTPTPPAPSAPKTTIDADGTYAVGTDVVPGVYSSAGPVADGTCSWRRTSNPAGATIDNALTHEPQIVQIDPTDKAFTTRGCQTWKLTPGASPDASAEPPVLAGLQLQAYLAQLKAKAALSGQLPPP